MLWYLTSNTCPYGKPVKTDSPLYGMLAAYPAICFEDYADKEWDGYKKLCTTKYLPIETQVLWHRNVPQKDHSIKQTIRVRISTEPGGSGKTGTIADHTFEIDETAFQNLIDSDEGKEIREKYRYLDTMAKRIMPEKQEGGHA